MNLLFNPHHPMRIPQYYSYPGHEPALLAWSLVMSKKKLLMVHKICHVYTMTATIIFAEKFESGQG